MEHLSVRVNGLRYEVRAGIPFTFGRAPSCSACLDPSDTGISREAGRIEHEALGWWVVNASSSRPFALVDEYGLRSVAPPGRRSAIEGPVRIIVDGQAGTHEVAVDGARPHLAPPTDPAVPSDQLPTVPLPGDATAFGANVQISAADHAALVALFAGYLHRGPRYDPNPRSYAAAAARLGWPRTTLVKRIEYLRTRLTAAGVPNLTGPTALNALAEWALTIGAIGPDDLTRLGR